MTGTSSERPDVGGWKVRFLLYAWVAGACFGVLVGWLT
jgi:hypothetical protein